ncbi:cation diffusion facilitator family transporter [Avibacterium sp. 21-586]|uniref:cation diffusion facilitator family transporter n=1 Tax=Avibacterium sp. 21-586 TaxID=2911534 RepID=UPI002247B244|nr:cation diffusion facilitator family transporter [Avibacterium sp. 21-586]MCW9710540.1 cation diffusion facilitator family transporter [Avibacterium sp. 21-586]
MHQHHHDHGSQNQRILAFSFAIITAYMVIEFLGGYYFNSLALMADAGHMANDSLSLLLTFVALFFSHKTQKYFALLNAVSLIIVAIWILWEAIERWQNPLPINALPMLSVATVGLLVNMIVAWLMLRSDHENLNIRAAYLHVLADLFGSVIAIIAGISAWLWQIQWIDIVASAILSIFILRSGVSIILQTIQKQKTSIH